MALMKWEPMREMEEMFDRLTRSFGPLRLGSSEVVAPEDWSPRVDIAENETEFEVKAELPEVRREDVHVTVDNGLLTLRGERRREKEEKGKQYHRIERSYGSFSRRFSLPDNVDGSKVEARFNDGMLSIRLPKTGESKSNAREVKIA
ncbi:MAG: Hsp20/alpha crystallin family protein [Rhodocyclaceae bacterium]|nr:Hsp20/alpha crystallin family protein [Rhodocyclaceae bacterium]